MKYKRRFPVSWHWSHFCCCPCSFIFFTFFLFVFVFETECHVAQAVLKFSSLPASVSWVTETMSVILCPADSLVLLYVCCSLFFMSEGLRLASNSLCSSYVLSSQVQAWKSTWFILCWGLNPGTQCMMGKHLPAELHSQPWLPDSNEVSSKYKTTVNLYMLLVCICQT